MIRGGLRILMPAVMAAGLGMGLAACAGGGEDFAALPHEKGRSLVENTGQKPLQCVPYAREHSDVKLYGDAWTWWDKAAGKFPREATPETGAVMVLTGYAGPERGHVAVVRSLVSPREIRVDHANWLGDGGVYLDDPVWDVSADNDWSAIKVWNVKTAAWGVRIYPVQGFIGPAGGAAPSPEEPMVAQTPDQIALLNLIKSQ
jgi:hypothetical protein